MQIDIDFDVFKALTALRRSETDTYNTVLRRLLDLPDLNQQIAEALLAHSLNKPAYPEQMGGLFGLAGSLGGAWFNGVHFPDGTLFRATYKGVTYTARIAEGSWIDQDGVVRKSPSDAASAVCGGTNVNGWRFWWCQLPGQVAWQRMDAFRK